MSLEKIAVPTDDANGLAGIRSEHFGHSRYFTFVALDKESVFDVNTVVNEPHGPGGCQSIVKFLRENSIDTVVATGMGNGPYGKLRSSGIRILFADKKTYPDVQSVIAGLRNRSIKPFEAGNLCRGSGNCHRHGRPQPVE